MAQHIDDHDTDEGARRKQQKHLRAILMNLTNLPPWFNRRFYEDTGISKTDHNCILLTTAGSAVLEAEPLAKVDVFLRKWKAGAITEHAGEDVIDTRSPFYTSPEEHAANIADHLKEEAARKAHLPRCRVHIINSLPTSIPQPAASMTPLQLTPRQQRLHSAFNRLCTWRGFKSAFCVAAKISPGTADKFYKGEAVREEILNGIERALGDASWQKEPQLAPVSKTPPPAPVVVADASTAASEDSRSTAARAAAIQLPCNQRTHNRPRRSHGTSGGIEPSHRISQRHDQRAFRGDLTPS